MFLAPGKIRAFSKIHTASKLFPIPGPYIVTQKEKNMTYVHRNFCFKANSIYPNYIYSNGFLRLTQFRLSFSPLTYYIIFPPENSKKRIP